MSAELHCIVRGSPLPTVSWMLPTKQINVEYPVDIRQIEEFGFEAILLVCICDNVYLIIYYRFKMQLIAMECICVLQITLQAPILHRLNSK